MLKCVNSYLSRDITNIELVPIGDVHYGSRQANIEEFIKTIDYVSSTPNCYAVLLGDLLEMSIEGSVGDVYSQTMTTQEQIDGMIELLAPIKNKILAAVSGNHSKRVSKKTGVDVMSAVMTGLVGFDKAKEIYHPDALCLFLNFSRNKGRNNRYTQYAVYINHGFGGGKAIGSKMNHLGDGASLANFDLVIMGHNHQPGHIVTTASNIDYRNQKINTKHVHLVSSTGYLNPMNGYGTARAWKPQPITTPHINLEGYDRKITVSL